MRSWCFRMALCVSTSLAHSLSSSTRGACLMSKRAKKSLSVSVAGASFGSNHLLLPRLFLLRLWLCRARRTLRAVSVWVQINPDNERGAETRVEARRTWCKASLPHRSSVGDALVAPLGSPRAALLLLCLCCYLASLWAKTREFGVVRHRKH